MQNEIQPLLTRLQAQIDADEDFAWAVANVGGSTPEQARADFIAIFADLFETAAAHWYEAREMKNLYRDRPDPKFSGSAVVTHHGPLHSCWIEHFSQAIMNVARSAETGAEDRAFLYFMLGVLHCGWHEVIRQIGKYERPATILNQIDVAAIPNAREALRAAREKFYPPRGWDWDAGNYRPPRVDVTVDVPDGLADLAAHLSPQFGVTPEKFMSTLLSEALQEAMMRIGRQVNPASHGK